MTKKQNPFNLVVFGGNFTISFIVLQVLFSSLENVDLAGDLAIKIFSRWHIWELIFIVLGQITFFYTRTKKNYLSSVVALLIISISLGHCLFLDEKIQILHEGIRSSTVNADQILAFQTDFNFYHSLTVILESAKLLLIVFLILIDTFTPFRIKDLSHDHSYWWSRFYRKCASFISQRKWP